jgi:GntR family transcriptional regulator / MocR family aminotransferase
LGSRLSGTHKLDETRRRSTCPFFSAIAWSGRPLEALQGLDTAGRVLYIGSFSKTLFPGLRLGYLVSPPALLEPLLFMRRAIDVHPPILEQMALCDFLREGYYARYLRAMRQVYRQRRDRLHDALRAHLGDLLDIQAPEAGLRLVGWLPSGVDDRRAAELAAQVGIEVDLLSVYGLAMVWSRWPAADSSSALAPPWRTMETWYTG